MPHRSRNHAVVVGGSIAGLLAARVLARHFDHITLVERDVLTRTAEPRSGVPQGRHAHALLLRGKALIEELFPGLSDDLVRAGSTLVSDRNAFAWHHGGAWRVQFDTDLSFLSLSRPLLESGIANRVLALPNVSVREGTRATEFVADEARAIRGVRVVSGHRGEAKAVEADLVIDATGRGSLTPKWLRTLGFPAPTTELLPARVTYATCLFEKAAPGPEWRTMLVTGAPAKRGGFIFSIEGNRWLVTLTSFFDEPTPHDHAGFLSFARSLAAPDLHEAIHGCKPMSDVVHYRFAGSQWRHYEALDRFPEGLIVLGDAVCSFNPVYGQGMSVSAIEAECLDRAFERSKRAGGIKPDFSRDWFRGIRPIVKFAWDAVLLEDYRFPELKRQRPLRLWPLQWYMDRVQRATYRSPKVTEQFYRVVGFLDTSSALSPPYSG
jgi:2-polyprenyl-6-methoxyphenol hydroxylase-like FAD-dependent oxidoreductase